MNTKRKRLRSTPAFRCRSSIRTHLDVAEGSQDVHLLIRYDYSCPGGVLDGVPRLAPLPGNAADRTTADADKKKQKKTARQP